MTSKTKALVLCGLQTLRGDDYERARAAFRNCTLEEMQEFYGGSGETRQQILDGYRQHARAVEAAIAEVNTL